MTIDLNLILEIGALVGAVLAGFWGVRKRLHNTAPPDSLPPVPPVPGQPPAPGHGGTHIGSISTAGGGSVVGGNLTDNRKE